MGWRRLVAVYGTAAGVFALDQLTKWLVVTKLLGEPPVRLAGDLVRLRYTSNPGGAFSLLSGFPLFFAAMAVVIMGAIVAYSRRATSTGVLAVLGLLLGGALGNFTDRLLRGERLLHGEVVDFVDVGDFPVFNVADSAITIGAITLAILLSRAPEPAGATDRTGAGRAGPADTPEPAP